MIPERPCVHPAQVGLGGVTGATLDQGRLICLTSLRGVNVRKMNQRLVKNFQVGLIFEFIKQVSPIIHFSRPNAPSSSDPTEVSG